MSRRVRILIVDDNPGVLKAVSRLLGFSHDVVGCIEDSSELPLAVQELAPDVIVLDFNLRNANGLEVCRQLRQSDAGVKVIVFTAADEPDVRRRALEAGAFAFVDKLSLDGGLMAVVDRLAAEAD